MDPWNSSEECHKNGLIPSHSRFRTSPAIHQHFILAQKSKQLCGTIKSRCYWANYNNYGFCQTGQLIHAVHVYLGHTSHHIKKNIWTRILSLMKKNIGLWPFHKSGSQKCAELSSENTVVPFARKNFDHKKYDSSIFQNSPKETPKGPWWSTDGCPELFNIHLVRSCHRKWLETAK